MDQIDIDFIILSILGSLPDSLINDLVLPSKEPIGTYEIITILEFSNILVGNPTKIRYKKNWVN